MDKLPLQKMKLSFVLALLASMAILSLSAPLLGNDEAMLQALAATLGAETHHSASADADATIDLDTSMTSLKGVRFISVSSDRSNWMSFSWVGCFDQSGACYLASWRSIMKPCVMF